MNIFENTKIAFQSKSNFELKRAHLLFKTVDMPFLVNLGAWSMPYLKFLPGIKPLIRKTVFAHFCGGETKKDSLSTVTELYSYKINSILDYSIEGKEEESAYNKCFNEINNIIELAKDNPAIPFVVFKPTGYGNGKIYEKVSNGEELNAEELKAWENIKERYFKTGENAFKNNVYLMIDAEESWYQKAVDELVVEMMKRFNQEKGLILNTLQMYRQDRLDYLKEQYQKAKEEDYYLGFKIVRGAYMEKERERAEAMAYPSPIHPNKEATDKAYNAAIEFLYDKIDRILFFAGTHNEESALILKDKLQNSNEPFTKNVWFGQLLGMSDNISFNLADLGFNVAKYVPYGPVNDVLPYLIRRAKENTSVAGQSSRELRLIEKELKRRKLKTSK